MSQRIGFHDVLEYADQLPVDDQESLCDILSKRIASSHRAELVQDVLKSRKEFHDGDCQPVTPDAIMDEILS